MNFYTSFHKSLSESIMNRIQLCLNDTRRIKNNVSQSARDWSEVLKVMLFKRAKYRTFRARI